MGGRFFLFFPFFDALCTETLKPQTIFATRQFTSTVICFGFTSSFFGRVIVSTPLSQAATTLSRSIDWGSEKLR
jgi:hypothetical protein